MLTQKRKNKKASLLAAGIMAAFCLLAGCSFLGSDLEHIEDTNGAEDYSLAVITEEDIIKQEMGALNIKMSTGLLNDGITFSSKKFTGVYQIFVTNFFFDSDFRMDVTGFYVNGGNFQMSLVNNDELVAVVEPDMFAECQLSDLNGSFSLVIAGESADFEFTLDRSFCEEYGIIVEE